ncbi:MAG: arsenate reductase family protein [Bacteroidales bacterium]|jgi:arsenate reductase|nr:arsenate reductase family protein [Bacteroidales bacterium]
MITIYHNPRCKISRQVLAEVEKHSEDVEIINYQKDKFTPKSLDKLLNLLHIEPFDLVRKNEAIYKSELKDKNFNRHEWIQIMCDNPRLIERPIVVKGYRGVVCRPPEKVFEILK